MAKGKPSRLQNGDTVNGWQIIEQLDDYAHPGRRVAYQRVRVACATCGKSLALTATQVPRTVCADCAKAATVPASWNAAELENRILHRYSVHVKICLALGMAPEPFEKFDCELRAYPDELLDDAPPQRETADYEQRDYFPLYTNGAN